MLMIGMVLFLSFFFLFRLSFVPEFFENFDILIVLLEFFLCGHDAHHQFSVGFGFVVALDVVFYKFSQFRAVDSCAALKRVYLVLSPKKTTVYSSYSSSLRCNSLIYLSESIRRQATRGSL
jgi:hypothetical protein